MGLVFLKGHSPFELSWDSSRLAFNIVLHVPWVAYFENGVHGTGFQARFVLLTDPTGVRIPCFSIQNRSGQRVATVCVEEQA